MTKFCISVMSILLQQENMIFFLLKNRNYNRSQKKNSKNHSIIGMLMKIVMKNCNSNHNKANKRIIKIKMIFFEHD